MSYCNRTEIVGDAVAALAVGVVGVVDRLAGISNGLNAPEFIEGDAGVADDGRTVIKSAKLDLQLSPRVVIQLALLGAERPPQGGLSTSAVWLS